MAKEIDIVRMIRREYVGSHHKIKKKPSQMDSSEDYSLIVWKKLEDKKMNTIHNFINMA